MVRLFSLLLCILPTMAFAAEQTSNVEAETIDIKPYSKHSNSQKKQTPQEKTYLYGYTSTELKAIPRKRVVGYKNPELIPEYKAWESFFSAYTAFYSTDPYDAWYALHRKVPLLSRKQMQSIVDVGTDSMLEHKQILESLSRDEQAMCYAIKSAVNNRQKLVNAKVKSLLSLQESKLPQLYEDIKKRLHSNLPDAIYTKLVQYVNNELKQGITYSELDIHAMAKLRSHKHSYSDLYEAVFCDEHFANSAKPYEG